PLDRQDHPLPADAGAVYSEQPARLYPLMRASGMQQARAQAWLDKRVREGRLPALSKSVQERLELTLDEGTLQKHMLDKQHSEDPKLNKQPITGKADDQITYEPAQANAQKRVKSRFDDVMETSGLQGVEKADRERVVMEINREIEKIKKAVKETTEPKEKEELKVFLERWKEYINEESLKEGSGAEVFMPESQRRTALNKAVRQDDIRRELNNSYEGRDISELPEFVGTNGEVKSGLDKESMMLSMLGYATRQVLKFNALTGEKLDSKKFQKWSDNWKRRLDPRLITGVEPVKAGLQETFGEYRRNHFVAERFKDTILKHADRYVRANVKYATEVQRREAGEIIGKFAMRAFEEIHINPDQIMRGDFNSYSLTEYGLGRKGYSEAYKMERIPLLTEYNRIMGTKYT
ncbi:hypothetical protein LCGC14_2815990, partial [marine sediment metagenome]